MIWAVAEAVAVDVKLQVELKEFCNAPSLDSSHNDPNFLFPMKLSKSSNLNELADNMYLLWSTEQALRVLNSNLNEYLFHIQ